MKTIIIQNDYPEEIYNWALSNCIKKIPNLFTGEATMIQSWLEDKQKRKKLVDRIMYLYQNKEKYLF